MKFSTYIFLLGNVLFWGALWCGAFLQSFLSYDHWAKFPLIITRSIFALAGAIIAGRAFYFACEEYDRLSKKRKRRRK